MSISSQEPTTKTMTVWLDQCVPGMRIAETITNDYSAIIVNAGTVLDNGIIDKLINANFQKIRIYTDQDKTIEYNSFETVRREYAEGADNMKEVLHDLTSGKRLNMSTITKVSGLMQTRRDDIVGVLSCLNQIRTADEYTYTHCLNVAFISQWIARWMCLEENILTEV